MPGQDTNVVDPAIGILELSLKNELLAIGEIGEVTGRLLLTLARDKASARGPPTMTFRKIHSPN